MLCQNWWESIISKCAMWRWGVTTPELWLIWKKSRSFFEGYSVHLRFSSHIKYGFWFFLAFCGELLTIMIWVTVRWRRLISKSWSRKFLAQDVIMHYHSVTFGFKVDISEFNYTNHLVSFGDHVRCETFFLKGIFFSNLIQKVVNSWCHNTTTA